MRMSWRQFSRRSLLHSGGARVRRGRPASSPRTGLLAHLAARNVGQPEIGVAGDGGERALEVEPGAKFDLFFGFHE